MATFTSGPYKRISDVYFPGDETGGYAPGTIKFTTGWTASHFLGNLIDGVRTPDYAYWGIGGFSVWVWQIPYFDPLGGYQWVQDYYDWYPDVTGGNDEGGHNFLVELGTPTTAEEILAGVNPAKRYQMFDQPGVPDYPGNGLGYAWSGLGCEVDICEMARYYGPFPYEEIVNTITTECNFGIFQMRPYYSYPGGGYYRCKGFTTEIPYTIGYNGENFPRMELEKVNL